MKLCVIRVLEAAFERLGRFISRWPYLVITLCLLWTGLCCVGFLNISFDSNIYEIWDTNPARDAEGTQSVANREWIANYFEDNKRTHSLIFTATDPNGNILTPNALQIMLKLHKEIVRPLQNVSFSDICYRLVLYPCMIPCCY